MLYVHLILILMLHEFLYVPGACDDEPDEALEIKVDGIRNPRTLCPPESKRDLNTLQGLSTRYAYVLRYCLFHQIFQEYGERTCVSEMKPIFKLYFHNETNETIKCGTGTDQLLHFFGYFYCGRMEESLKQLRNVENSQELIEYNQLHKPKDIPMYDICYDTNDIEAVYTKHRIWNPPIYQQYGFQEQFYFPTEIGTDPFYMNKERISNMKNFYENQKQKNPNTRYRMFPRPLVPPQHFALRTLKKTTNHYFNMAPLWENLFPLMDVIDEGIKIAALKVFQPPANEEEEPEELLIFTKVVALPNRRYSNVSKKWNQMKTPIYQPNIWYKFLYNEKRRQGVIIYIHNEPEGPTDKQCAPSESVQCNFQTWWTPPENYSESPSEPIDFVFAYCCEITTQEANRLFFGDFTIEDILEIDSVIKLQSNVVQSWDTGTASSSQTHELYGASSWYFPQQ